MVDALLITWRPSSATPMAVALLEIDWSGLFVPSQSVPEIIVRGTLTYLALFTLMRVILKRETGTVGTADLLMVVLIADAAQNAMASDYKSITEGVVLVATIIFWNYALDWLGYRLAFFGRVIHPPPLELVRDGRMLRRNMRQEMITEDELMSHLREQGVDRVADVRRCFIEGDGRISVIKAEGGGPDSQGSPGDGRRPGVG